MMTPRLWDKKFILLSILCIGFLGIVNRTAALVVSNSEVVSVNASGEWGNQYGWDPAISGDGKYVVFASGANNLVPNDNNHQPDYFLRDRMNQTTSRIATAPWVAKASLSWNGQYTAFVSTDILAEGDFNGVSDVFVYNRVTHLTESISKNSSGIMGNGASGMPSISADGRYVAFSSYASNLVPNDTNNKMDIFLYDRNTGVTKRISEDSHGNPANDNSDNPVLSSDGCCITFQSQATNLVVGDTNNNTDIFVYDRDTGAISRVSVDSDGNQGNGSSVSAAISNHGHFVVFQSSANNLVPGDTNNTGDIFLHDRETGITRRIAEASSSPTISADGRYIAFKSDLSEMWGRVSAYDRIHQTTHIVGGGAGNETYAPAIAANGYAVVYGNLNYYIYPPTGEWEPLPTASPIMLTRLKDDTPICASPDPLAHLSAVIEPTNNPNEWQARIYNESACVYDVGFATYEKVDVAQNHQTLFSSDTRLQIGYGETLIPLTVPTCAAQLDVFFDASHLGVYNNFAGQQDALNQVPLVLSAFATHQYGVYGDWYESRLLSYYHKDGAYCATEPAYIRLTHYVVGDPTEELANCLALNGCSTVQNFITGIKTDAPGSFVWESFPINESGKQHTWEVEAGVWYSIETVDGPAGNWQTHIQPANPVQAVAGQTIEVSVTYTYMPSGSQIVVTKEIIGADTGEFTICVGNVCKPFVGNGATQTWAVFPGIYPMHEEYAGSEWNASVPSEVSGIAGQTVYVTVTNMYIPPNVCSSPDPLAHLSAVIEPTNNPTAWQARIHNASACLYDVGFATYEKLDSEQSHQTLFTSDTRLQIGQGETLIPLTVPNCAAQLDVFFDASHLGVYNNFGGQQTVLDAAPLVLPHFATNLYGQFGNWYGPRLLTYKHLAGTYCAPIIANDMDAAASPDETPIEATPIEATPIEATPIIEAQSLTPIETNVIDQPLAEATPNVELLPAEIVPETPHTDLVPVETTPEIALTPPAETTQEAQVISTPEVEITPEIETTPETEITPESTPNS